MEHQKHTDGTIDLLNIDEEEVVILVDSLKLFIRKTENETAKKMLNVITN